MVFSLATYNIFFNQAYAHLDEVFKGEKPDIVCLQEIETDENNLKKFENSTFKLADYTNSFVKFGKIFGVATFYNPDKFEFVESTSIDLPRSFLEIVLIVLRGINRPRTALKTDFIYKPSKKKVSIYNLHLTPFSSNGTRIKQIKEILQNINIYSKHSTVLAGDFNYPYGRKKFESLIENYRLKEATNNILFTIEGRLLKLFQYRAKLDYILYKNMGLLETKKIHLRHSDHFPIISKFQLE